MAQAVRIPFTKQEFTLLIYWSDGSKYEMLPKIELLWVLTWYYTLKKSDDKLVAKQDMDIPSRLCVYEVKMKFALNLDSVLKIS